MSQRLTYAQIKNQVGQPVSLTGDNPNLLPLVNESIFILWESGDVIGKYQNYKIKVVGDCNGNKCITWPRQVETIEAINVCNSPVRIHTQFYEFQNNATGEIGKYNNNFNGQPYGGLGYRGLSMLGDRTEVVLQQEVSAGQKKIQIFTERIETTGNILILGYDDNGNWIRAQRDGVWQDGELLPLSGVQGQTTINYFSNVTGIQFDYTPRNGNVYVYQLDTLGNQVQLATYDYAVSTPVFRKSILAGLPNPQFDQNSDGQPRCQTVQALCKMRFMPVIYDTDYPQVSNIPALKCMLQYIYKRDADKLPEAKVYLEEAKTMINDELKQFNGYGSRKTINWLPFDVWASNKNMR